MHVLCIKRHKKGGHYFYVPIQEEGHVINGTTKGKPKGTFIAMLRDILQFECGQVRSGWRVVVVGMVAFFAMNGNWIGRRVLLLGQLLLLFEQRHGPGTHGAQKRRTNRRQGTVKVVLGGMGRLVTARLSSHGRSQSSSRRRRVLRGNTTSSKHHGE